MITSVDYGKVRYFRMARTFLGRAPYWTGVYFIDGLLGHFSKRNLVRAFLRPRDGRAA